MSEQNIMVLSTVPDEACASALAERMVSERLAACVNIVPGITSVYLWEGKIVSDSERLLLIKTTRRCYSRLEALILQRHPYDLPEIIVLPIQQGHADYLKWITTCTTAHDG